MNILLLSATPFEIMPVLDSLEREWISRGNGKYQKGSTNVQTLIAGVGMVATAWHLGQYLARFSADLVIQAGVGGALDRKLSLGTVVQVIEEQFGDLGVQEANGAFTDLFDLGLLGADQAPFSRGALKMPTVDEYKFLPQVKGLTVNKVHGYEPSIEAIRVKYPHVQVESMEGAAAFYGCLLAGIPCLQLRSISNYVESRNRDAWELGLAIEQLGKTLNEILNAF